MKFSEGGQYENPPCGSHIARCYSLVDLGTQQHTFGQETWAQRDVRISWELPGELMAGLYNPDVKGKPFAVHLTLKQSLHPKSRLRKILVGWRGRDFTKEEAASFDPKKLIGLACRVSLVQSQNGDFINVDSVAPLGKAEKCPKKVNAAVFFSLEPAEFDIKSFGQLGEKTQERIKKSPEWQALAAGEQQPDPEPEPDDGGQPDGADSSIPF